MLPLLHGWQPYELLEEAKHHPSSFLSGWASTPPSVRYTAKQRWLDCPGESIAWPMFCTVVSLGP